MGWTTDATESRTRTQSSIGPLSPKARREHPICNPRSVPDLLPSGLADTSPRGPRRIATHRVASPPAGRYPHAAASHRTRSAHLTSRAPLLPRPRLAGRTPAVRFTSFLAYIARPVLSPTPKGAHARQGPLRPDERGQTFYRPPRAAVARPFIRQPTLASLPNHDPQARTTAPATATSLHRRPGTTGTVPTCALSSSSLSLSISLWEIPAPIPQAPAVQSLERGPSPRCSPPSPGPAQIGADVARDSRRTPHAVLSSLVAQSLTPHASGRARGPTRRRLKRVLAASFGADNICGLGVR